MTNELQADSSENGITLDNDHIENDEINEQNAETAESGAELAPAAEDKQDKSDDGKKAQEAANKAINKQHAKYREEERKRIESDEKLRKAEDKLAAFEAKQGEIIIPALPEPYDEDYEVKMKERDDAITRKAQQDAQKQSLVEANATNAEAAKKADDDRFQTVVIGYNAQITKLGLNADELRIAGDTVVNNGIDASVAEYILGDEDGPLITKYLAENPIVQDDLRNLPPIQAAMKIDSVIRPAASGMKPQASAAPDPSETLSGRGAGEQKHPLIAGAKFE